MGDTATRIGALREKIGEEVRIQGWLYNRRSSGKLEFLLVRDGSGTVQCVAVKAELPEAVFAKCAAVTQESSVRVTGIVREDKRAPSGVELSLRDLEVVGPSVDFPITPKEHGPSFLLDQRHLWIRSPRQAAILKVRHSLVQACRDWLNRDGFILADAPIFTPSACEGTTTLFETQYFGEKAYLTQSGQLYNEATAMAFGKTYCFGPTFRAEKSKTRRHLIEFWMVEPEIAFATLEDVMALIERFVEGIVGRVLEERREELKVLERDPAPLEGVKAPFPRVSYDEAVRILKEKKGLPFEWGSDFGAADETALTEDYDRPFFVHGFPAAVKAFYMKRDPKDDRLSLSCDLLAPEGYGEIVGGGEREDSLDRLVGRIREHELPLEAFEWYLDLRRYGSVPHSGFGMGIERTLTWICGIEHLRETIPFPRMLNRLRP
ncbi:MAG: asparagine--tRNA ligase [Candidatus Eisenbacteria bacterium]|uniref:Asparagine--tRNA ligase n=1 Tax=Eiseniibacteriota bacterium TaxID=2212470 RepID=A0A538TCY7_UNCEI|nr:MAG: asparagine--tRNA ligase [Candidatus Eisenbacteria bacterium]